MNDYIAIEPRLMLTTGPVSAFPAVLRAMSRPVIYDTDPVFQHFYEQLIGKLRRVMRLSNRPVVLQGEPVLGLEAAAASLIAPGDTVLNLVSGVYGKGFGSWARRYAQTVVDLETAFNNAIDPAAVAAELRAHPEISVVSVCHHDTPSGTLNPIDDIGAIVRAHGAYLIVDAVSSFGGMDTHPEDCLADLYVTGPSKCLGCPPGLTLLGVSERGWEKMRANAAAPRGSFLSILDWEHAWSPDRPFPFTPSISALYGLDAALDLYLEEGPANVWARHALTARAARAGIQAMGLDLWAAREEIAAPTATAFKTPAGIDEAALRAELRARYGIVLSGGRGATAGKLTRIGHMGPTAYPIHALTAVAAIGGALASLGFAADAGAGVMAAQRVIDEAR